MIFAVKLAICLFAGDVLYKYFERGHWASPEDLVGSAAFSLLQGTLCEVAVRVRKSWRSRQRQ
jgi:hypothetical protein